MEVVEEVAAVAVVTQAADNRRSTKRLQFFSAFLAEKARTPPRNFFGGVFLSAVACQSLRDFGILISFIVTRSPSVAYGASSLQEGAFVALVFSADSGFGLLPDRARTATRYACPRRE